MMCAGCGCVLAELRELAEEVGRLKERVATLEAEGEDKAKVASGSDEADAEDNELAAETAKDAVCETCKRLYPRDSWRTRRLCLSCADMEDGITEVYPSTPPLLAVVADVCIGSHEAPTITLMCSSVVARFFAEDLAHEHVRLTHVPGRGQGLWTQELSEAAQRECERDVEKVKENVALRRRVADLEKLIESIRTACSSCAKEEA